MSGWALILVLLVLGGVLSTLATAWAAVSAKRD